MIDAVPPGHPHANTRRLVHAAFRVLVLSALMGIGTVNAQMPATPRTIDQGAQSNIDDARQVVVRSESEWTTLWRQHSPNRPRPALDFSREMIVGVFMGSRPTAGFSVSILAASATDNGLVVRYQEKLPARDAMTAQVITSPFHLVAVPKTAGDVKFEKVN